MSTKTTFKRIALVAVAALGLGVLSVAPSSATVSGLTVTVGGTATSAAGQSDSLTAATITIAGFVDNIKDSVTVQFIESGARPTAITGYSSTAGVPKLAYLDTTTAAAKVQRGSNSSYTAQQTGPTGDSVTVSTELSLNATGGNQSIGARFTLQLDSVTAPTPGTYNYLAVVKQYNYALGDTLTLITTTHPVSITVARPATLATTVDPSKSTAILSGGSSFVAGTTSDSSVAVVSTASTTAVATLRVVTQNAASTSAPESITATITGAGLICDGTSASAVCGSSIVVAGSGSTDLGIRANGTAGTGSIVIKTTTVTFPAKTVTFFAKAAKTITVAVARPVIGVGTTNDVIRATAVDADGNVWGGAAFIVADTAADALIAGSSTPVACTFNAARGYHECPVAGTAVGTAKLDVIDASTVALATATSAPASVRVTTGSPTKATIAFDKATYAPGEKAQIWVGALDAAGLPLSERTITNIFAAGGITSTSAFSTGSDSTLTDVSVAIAGATSATSGTVAGYKVYTVYMPFASGDVTISATGGTGLAAAGRVALSATASVVNSSVDAATDAANEATDAANAATDAALAAADAADAATAAAQDASDAVAALSASVSKLISSLRAQITSLTNLVIKIQKKVRA
jgi:trimeric autotransporter adhesin